jgi:nucleotide-binding universal stress UspA family protein
VKTSFKRLIVAVDGSPTAEAGVLWAVNAAGDETTLLFCCVVDPAPLATAGDAPVAPPTSLAELQAAAHAICDAGVSTARAHGVPAHAFVFTANAALGILGCARDHSADAIVIGSHGRTGLARALAGSVAEAVIRSSDVPVVVVHAGDRVRVGPIAVAVDESDASGAALTTAIALAQAAACELRLFHVFGHVDYERIDALGQSSQERLEHASLEAAATLEDAADRVRASGVAFEASMLAGKPVDGLLKTIERHACSSVVTGTHGRSAFERLLFGSVAAGLVEHARIPVIVVRARS